MTSQAQSDVKGLRKTLFAPNFWGALLCILTLGGMFFVAFPPNAANAANTISFGGYTWNVKTGQMGPGPDSWGGSNYWSASPQNVWVDASGGLHLKITQTSGQWYCAEVILSQSLGYGQYIFQLNSRVDQLSPIVVASPFFYQDDNHEVDIEFSRWADPARANNAQYVVSPSSVVGNINRFPMALDSSHSAHVIDWEQNFIHFTSIRGAYTATPSPTSVLKDWTWTGAGALTLGSERMHINIWLYRDPAGQAINDEFIVGSFTFIPSGTHTTTTTTTTTTTRSTTSTTTTTTSTAPTPAKRTITFSGYAWNVKSGRYDPGPNAFSSSSSNVWVDSSGNLHLKITKVNGVWYCAEVTLARSLGYGQYVFKLASRVDTINPLVVAAPFIYQDDTHELDVEFSRWGGGTRTNNAQYAVQPADLPGNLHRFMIKLNGDFSTHIITWVPNAVTFQSIHGHYLVPPSSNYLIQSWTWKGTNVFTLGQERVHINLWLNKAPAAGQDVTTELIISSFQFIPSTSTASTTKTVHALSPATGVVTLCAGLLVAITLAKANPE